MWRDFPDRLASCDRRRRLRLFARRLRPVQSRSTLPRPLSYMHDEAREVLPPLLDAIGFRRGLLLGHSDGASIATIHAGSIQDHRVRGLILIAPHFFVEDLSIASIAEAKTAYAQTDCARSSRVGTRTRQRLPRLERRLARSASAMEYHSESSPISASRSWSCRGKTINTERYARSKPHRRNAIARSRWRCFASAKHSPQREAPEATLKARWSEFSNRLLRDHAEGHIAA